MLQEHLLVLFVPIMLGMICFHQDVFMCKGYGANSTATLGF